MVESVSKSKSSSKRTGLERGEQSNVKFQPFIPAMPSQNMLREILSFAIGPDDKHLLYLWARRLCKKSIVLIEHPTFAQLRALLTPLQSLTHVYVYSQSDVDNIRNTLSIL